VALTCDNLMEVGLDYLGVWEKFSFQLPDCFNGNCCGMQVQYHGAEKTFLCPAVFTIFR
jgi:hypothetical protein